MKEMIQTYLKKCPPWTPLALLITGVVLFFLGLILGAAMIKAIWFLIALAAPTSF